MSGISSTSGNSNFIKTPETLAQQAANRATDRANALKVEAGASQTSQTTAETQSAHQTDNPVSGKVVDINPAATQTLPTT